MIIFSRVEILKICSFHLSWSRCFVYILALLILLSCLTRTKRNIAILRHLNSNWLLSFCKTWRECVQKIINRQLHADMCRSMFNRIWFLFLSCLYPFLQSWLNWQTIYLHSHYLSSVQCSNLTASFWNVVHIIFMSDLK
jgi:hypothetical protein